MSSLPGPHRVLLIDDDERLFELLSEYLDKNGIDVDHQPNGTAGLAAAERGAYDAILLDGMMPGLDGLEVLKRLRASSTIPILMLTARGDEADRVVGLEMGADDYIAKPFSPRELLARLRAVLRRVDSFGGSERLVAAGIEIDVGARTASVDGARAELTGIEFDILEALVRRAGRVVPRGALLAFAGRDDATVSDRTVDVHISKLRRKLGDDSRSPTRIRTVRGVGYTVPRSAD